jgi:hypothetical protein
MGHEVIARSLEVSQVAAATAETRPNVALVGLGERSQHALDLIEEREAFELLRSQPPTLGSQAHRHRRGRGHEPSPAAARGTETSDGYAAADRGEGVTRSLLND